MRSQSIEFERSTDKLNLDTVNKTYIFEQKALDMKERYEKY